MQDIWQSFFDGDHARVLAATDDVLNAHAVADHLHLSGLSLLSLGRADLGVARLSASVSLAPQLAWFANAAISALSANRAEDALDFARQGLGHHADSAVLYFSQGNALMALGRLAEAEASLRHALLLDPALDDAVMNLGNCLRRQNQPEAAIGCYDMILRKTPGHGAALINRVGAMLEMADTTGAASILEQIMAQADVPEVAFMLAMSKLAKADYRDGWSLYRRRWDCAMAKVEREQFKKPLLGALAEAAGKHVLVLHEQGFGDSLQFVRFVPKMLSHAAKVTVLAPAPLKRLFQRIDPQVQVVTSREQAGDYDFECPMLDQPFLHGTTIETIPNALPYLGQGAVAVGGTDRGKRRRVGLCWAGQLRNNPDLAAVDRRRSMQLAQFEPLLAVPNVSFVSLQLGDPAAQSGGAPWHGAMTQPLDGSFDFYDTASVIKGLDLVIAVDSAVAHLSAACGVPTWVLSRYDGCWRWLEGRIDSPWYPGVLRLFQQTKPGDWNGVMAELLPALQQFCG